MTESVPVWEQRLRATRVSLPEWARDAPHRCLYVSNPTGTFELHAWDRSTGSVRQVTDREHGTVDGTLSVDGEHVWWFDDTAGDELGTWKRQPFAGGPDVDAAPGVPAAYSAGLELGRDVVVVGCSDDDGSTVWLQRPGHEPEVLYASEHDAGVGALSRDEDLVAVEHSEHGDMRYKALRVFALEQGRPGAVVGELWDGEGLGLTAVAFSPVPGDRRLLCLHEQRGRQEPLVWDPVSGDEQRLALDLPGDLDVDWFPDGSALLVRSEARGRSTLHRVTLDGSVTDLPTPPGTVGDATARPDGTVEHTWSSAAEPTVVRSTSGEVVLVPPGPRAPGSVPVTDAFVEGPGGTVHALVAVPAAGDGPFPTVFLVHGGPTWHDSDAFAADRAAYVDLGCAVVQVNYRGSTGYGSAWRDALTGRPGLTELEDVDAVRRWAVEQGVADPQRCALTGGSWGGYLTLLGLGTQPEHWAVGVAAVPVADYLAAYQDEMEQLRAFDRALFGGAPDEVGDLYARCSPITYVDAVRAPVLVLAGENDPRCPIRQVENYLAALAERGLPHEVYRFDAGHGSLVVDERVRQLRAELAFVARHLGLPGPGLSRLSRA
jgi:acetyl esterase/lipase